MNILHSLVIVSTLVLANARAPAQSTTFAPPTDSSATFDSAASDVHKRLEASLAELTQLREQIAAEKIPLSRTLAELENELLEVRQQYQKTTRLLDTRTLDLTNLRAEITSRQEEASYLSNLFGEYNRNFESRLHIAELQRYREQIDAAGFAVENSSLAAHEVFDAQSQLLTMSLERLHEALGGAQFDGRAVDANRLVKQGTFILVGPVAVFRAAEGGVVGTAEQRLGSLEPSITAFETPEDIQAATSLASGAGGLLPLDPTLGNAHKIIATKETLREHIQKGGPVMVPIFVLAGLALLVAVYKWMSLLFVRKPSRKRLAALLGAIANRDVDGARTAVQRVRGPTGRMLSVGVDHLNEPRELIEEVMYETVLSTRLNVHRFLPFIAICAASAPLLGLLGTVTGIMNTFKLITVFGTGDVKTLSSGISEALITTEFGLIVAIPSLLLHALLSRKAKGVIDQMERAAVAFLNQVSRTPIHQAEAEPRIVYVEREAETTSTPPTSDEVTEVLAGLLEPLVRKNLDNQSSRVAPTAVPHTTSPAHAEGPARRRDPIGAGARGSSSSSTE